MSCVLNPITVGGSAVVKNGALHYIGGRLFPADPFIPPSKATFGNATGFFGTASPLNVVPPVHGSSGSVNLSMMIDLDNMQFGLFATWSGFWSPVKSFQLRGPTTEDQNGTLQFEYNLNPYSHAGLIQTPLYMVGPYQLTVINLDPFPLTHEQISQILSEQWYFVVCTSLYPNGEIRGTIKPILTLFPYNPGQIFLESTTTYFKTAYQYTGGGDVIIS